MKVKGGVAINRKGSARDKISNAVEYLQKWIIEFVSVNNPDLNNFPPCPFAKQALVEQKIKFAEVKNIKDCLQQIRDATVTWNENLDLIAFVFTKLPNENQLVSDIEMIYRLLKANDFVVLEDHPFHNQVRYKHIHNLSDWQDKIHVRKFSYQDFLHYHHAQISYTQMYLYMFLFWKFHALHHLQSTQLTYHV